MPKAKRAKDGRWKKLTYDEVNQCFEEAGCVLLSETYINARAHLDYICSCGNRSRIIFDSFRRGHRCQKCRSMNNSNRFRLSYKQVKKEVERLGFKMLQDDHVDSHAKIKLQCKCGNIFYRHLGNIKNKKNTCPCCALKGRSGVNHYEWRKDREQYKEDCDFRQRSYKILKHALTGTGKEKVARTIDMLGYTHLQLRDHVKNHKNWPKLKNRQWHLDHIFPIQAFLDFGITDIKLMNALDNLQPLSARENLCKNHKYNPNEFKTWLRSKGVAA